MFRTTAVRSLPRSFTTFPATAPRANLFNNALRASLKTSARPIRASRILSVAVAIPVQRSVVRYASHNAGSYDTAKAEKTLGEQILKPVPALVSESSTIRSIAGEVQPNQQEDDVEMMAGIRSDFVGHQCCTEEPTRPLTRFPEHH